MHAIESCTQIAPLLTQLFRYFCLPAISSMLLLFLPFLFSVSQSLLCTQRITALLMVAPLGAVLVLLLKDLTLDYRHYVLLSPVVTLLVVLLLEGYPYYLPPLSYSHS